MKKSCATRIKKSCYNDESRIISIIVKESCALFSAIYISIKQGASSATWQFHPEVNPAKPKNIIDGFLTNINSGSFEVMIFILLTPAHYFGSGRYCLDPFLRYSFLSLGSLRLNRETVTLAIPFHLRSQRKASQKCQSMMFTH